MQTMSLNLDRTRLALGGLAAGVAVWAAAVGVEPGLGPPAALVGALLILGVAAWVELARRLSRQALEAKTAGADPADAYRGWEGRALAAASAAALLGLVGALVLSGVRVRRADAPVSLLRSPTFHLLPGCPASAAGLRVLPTRCDDPRYQIRYAASAFGLPYPERGLYWLRVGADAVFVRFCDEEACRLGPARRDVFPTRATVR